MPVFVHAPESILKKYDCETVPPKAFIPNLWVVGPSDNIKMLKDPSPTAPKVEAYIRITPGMILRPGEDITLTANAQLLFPPNIRLKDDKTPDLSVTFKLIPRADR